MDVHPPHAPVQSLKDFLVHMLAITLGLLIALGLEAAVQAIHHRHLVSEARENIHQELLDNQHAISLQLDAVLNEQKQLEAVSAYIHDVVNGRKPTEDIHSFRWMAGRLSDTAWQTSASTGATSHMSYAMAKQYDRIYQLQSMFNATMDHNLQARADMYSLLNRLDQPGKPFASEVEFGLRAVNQEAVYEEFLLEIGRQTNDLYSAALQQR